MKEPIRLLILCSWGATSSRLAKQVQEAANRRGISLVADADGISAFKQGQKPCDVALLEPQVRHLKKEVSKAASERGIPWDLVDPVAFATMDGDRVLEQVLQLIQQD
jgi:PTS system cellobiose-specific IIB component